MVSGIGHPDDEQGTSATDEPASCQTARGDRRTALLAFLMVVLLCLVIAVLLWWSRDWPLIQDPPVLNYVAWRISEGDALYRDQFGINFPGAYAVHLLALKVLGPGDAAWRAFDLIWLALTAAICGIYCRRFGRLAAISGPLMFALFHLNGSALRAGQRDYMLVAFLVAASHFVARFCEGRGRLGSLVVAGLLIGAATTIKPFTGLFWAFLVVYSGIESRRLGRRWWSASGAVIGGGLIPVAAVTVWLGAMGSLGAFVEVATRYLPLYGRAERLPPSILLRIVFSSGFFVVLLGIAAAPFCRAALGRSGRLGPARTLLLAGLIYGGMHFGIQGKGWGYHQYPQMAFACLMAVAAGWQGTPGAGRRAAVQWTTLVALAIAAGIGVYSLATYRGNVPRKKVAYMSKLVDEVDERTDPGDTVQVLDATAGGLDMLVRLRLRQPTAFLYDFSFYHHAQHPYIQTLRDRFLRELKASPPKVVVFFEDVWPHHGDGYRRLERFPGLHQWLAANYRVDVDHGEYDYAADYTPNYRIYVRTQASLPRPAVRQ